LIALLSIIPTMAVPVRHPVPVYQDTARYYYSGNKRIYINTIPGSNLFTIGFKRDSASMETQHSISALRTVTPIAGVKWHKGNHAMMELSGTGFNSSEYFRLKRGVVERDSNIKYINPVYYPVATSAKGSQNATLLETDEIIVKFKPNTSRDAVKEFNSRYQLKTVDSTLDFTVYEVPKFADAIDIANDAQEKQSIVEYAQPNFLIKLTGHQVPADPYFKNQFYLYNTGQLFNNNPGQAGADISILGAWAISKGDPSVVIAVIDQGVSDPHPDLPDARQVRLKGSNFSGSNPDDPSPAGDVNHGNACAGIVAAEHNSEGISGIAPLCRIMPICIPIEFTEAGVAQVAAAINFAWRNGASVISCSWGSEFADPNQFVAITSAINSAVTLGRNNLGCVVIFSAGDNAIHDIGNTGYIYFPDNVRIPYVFTVGASDRYNRQSNYSPTASPTDTNNQKIDVVAPSSSDITAGEIWTIDIPGVDGDNPDKKLHDTMPNDGVNYLAYAARFGGTSASCPEVAGVSALILSVNPKLTAQQVYNIIVTTADEVGGYKYTNNISFELGYGKINAAKALSLAAQKNR
jgi:subtilisin family serine protease